MRILIIALSRSGGYQLNEWLALELGYKIIHEPTKSNESVDGDNIVVKYLMDEIQNKLDTFDWSSWDKIIGLTRINVRECAISQSWAIYKTKWCKRYEISDEWLKKNQKDISNNEAWLNGEIESINGISEIELRVTYEGIYDTKEDIQRIKDYIGITNIKYGHKLNNTNRLRKTNLSSWDLI